MQGINKAGRLRWVEHNELYLLKDEITAVVGVAIKTVNQTDLWHIMLDHPSFKAMQHISSLKDHIDVGKYNCCHTCLINKQSRLAFPDSHNRSDCWFQLIHVDVQASYKKLAYDKKQYFATIVDDFSRFTWICPIQCKTEVHLILKNFLTIINTQFGAKT